MADSTCSLQLLTFLADLSFNDCLRSAQIQPHQSCAEVRGKNHDLLHLCPPYEDKKPCELIMCTDVVLLKHTASPAGASRENQLQRCAACAGLALRGASTCSRPPHNHEKGFAVPRESLCSVHYVCRCAFLGLSWDLHKAVSDRFTS